MSSKDNKSQKSNDKKGASNGKKAEPKAPHQRASGFAMVKAVTSGDSIVVMGGCAPGQTPPEKNISISGITAPKFGRGRSGQDEPFAFAAREFLRQKLIGKTVFFSSNHAAGNRVYADVFFGPNKQENLAHTLVSRGWCRVKEQKGDSTRIYPERQAMLDLENGAIARGLGVHNKNVNSQDQIRLMDWMPDPTSLFQKFKGKPIPAIVDYVRDGSTFRCELHGNNLNHTMITLFLAGVACPRTPIPHSVQISQWERRKEENPDYDAPRPKKQKAGPFAIEAKSFAECRLLHRNVQVVLQGVDKFNNLFGSLLFSKGNITVKMVELGLGKMIPWAAAITPDLAAIQAAAQSAKEHKLRLWKNWDPSDEKESPADYSATVVRVNSGDSIAVVPTDAKTDDQIRLNFASIQCPRMGNRRRKESDKPYAWEAREFLRKKLIGKTVRVSHEYDRDPPMESTNQKARPFVTVYASKLNVSEALIRMGYATVVRHRPEEPRAAAYDKYIQLENQAVSAKRGIHHPNPPKQRVLDLTVRKPRKKDDAKDDDKDKDVKDKDSRAKYQDALPSKARQHLPFLQSEKRLMAVIEYCFGGTRFKLYIPKNQNLIIFYLAGVRTQRSTQKDPDSGRSPMTEFEKTALQIASKYLQHDVRIEVEACDRNDNFLGSMFLGQTNLAVELLKKGLVEIIGFSASKSPYAEQLYEAEREAKEAKLNIWENYVETVDDDEEDDEKVAQTSALREGGDFVDVEITEIVDASNFYIKLANDANGTEIMEKMDAFNEENPPDDADADADADDDADDDADADADAKNDADADAKDDKPTGYQPSKGTVAAGLYSDGRYYRVRVDGITAQKTWRVFFIDYGNHELLAGNCLKPLPKDLQAPRGLAKNCSLAGVKSPATASDYYRDAVEAFNNLTLDKKLAAMVKYIDRQGKLHVVLKETDNDNAAPEDSINRDLLREGYVRRLEGKRIDNRVKKYVESLQDDEEDAIQHHRGIWEYGNVSDDEDDEKERWDGGRVPRRRV
jgi:staphylococcal nuclease domain-containing protein 1